ncbi:MAG: bifunctional metallophosphatase/5'-nucleotidase [Elusimicrobia bacterium]|nr:bifunctional metallophosphatase/5'-nucleotidase [Elusimicrobiota bacterium]
MAKARSRPGARNRKIVIDGGDRVYVDLDDVLAETARTLLGVLERDFGKKVLFDDVRHFDLGRSLGLEPDELAEFMNRIHQPDVLLALPPVEGAFPVLETWIRAGCEVCIVTGRPSSTQGPTREWLERHAVPHSGVLFVDKYSRQSAARGASVALSLDELSAMPFALAIDDAPTMLSFLLERMTASVIIRDRPWNRTDVRVPRDARDRVLRCAGWAEIAVSVKARTCPRTRRTAPAAPRSSRPAPSREGAPGAS